VAALAYTSCAGASYSCSPIRLPEST